MSSSQAFILLLKIHKDIYQMKTVITFGTFDLFHEGHLRILERASEMGDRLVVGVSSDSFNFDKKQRYPIIKENSRRSIIAALKCVDEVFSEESLELKQHYVETYGASVLVMGDDWSGAFEIPECETIYLPRTADVSTTDILKKIRRG